MKIRELYLKSFGKFTEKKLVFGDGVNVIYGHNEAGKTTVYTAIGAMLFGLERQRGRASQTDSYKTYQPWEYPTLYAGSMKFETGGKMFCIERNFYRNEKSARLFCETDGEELSVEQGDLTMLLGGVTGDLYFNTAAAGQLKMKPQDIVYSYLKNYIAGLAEGGSNELDVVRALEILEKKRKELEQKKRKEEAEIRKQIAAAEAKMNLTEKELAKSREQLFETQSLLEKMRVEAPKRDRGFLRRLFEFLKRLLFGKTNRRERGEQNTRRLKMQEKERLLRDLCGEQESLLEELSMERDAYFERLHEQSNDEELRAVALAAERIRELSVVRQEEVFEKLLLKASRTLATLTGGKYEKIILEKEKEPAVWDGQRNVRIFRLSTGCAEQVYLSIRIALQDLFFEDEKLPLIFDDAFAYFDDERLERLLCALPSLDRQVLLLTCHKREAELLERAGVPHRRIELG